MTRECGGFTVKRITLKNAEWPQLKLKLRPTVVIYAELQHAAAAADTNFLCHHFFHRQLAGHDVFTRIVGIGML